MLLAFCMTVLCALFAPSFQQAVINSSPTFVEDLRTVLVVQGIYENTTVGTVIGTLSCTDPDGDPIGYFVSRSSAFSVGILSGEVTLVKPLDREQTVNSLNPDEKPNSVTFECLDFDENGAQKSIQTVHADYDITVRDNNDLPPTFATDSLDGFTFNVKESDPPGTVLAGVISVTDGDLGENAKLESLSFFCDGEDKEPCQMFRLDYREVKEGLYTAQIVLQQNLDFERRRNYRTKVRAVDGPLLNRKNTASIGVRIVVEDSQDTDPLFVQSDYNFELTEGLQRGTQINFSLSARDGDTGAKRAIFLEVLDDSNGYNLFRAGDSTLVEPVNGIYSAPLILQRDVDQEELRNGYRFFAKATETESDGSLTNATATAQFSVTIRDVNDNSPLFSASTYNFTVPELGEVASGVLISSGTIAVNDIDLPQNAQFMVEIVSQTYNGAFAITPTNTIATSTQIYYMTVNNFQYLDYDQPQYRSQSVILRAVEIINGGQRGSRSSSATVSITLSDINDNAPRFERQGYAASVLETAGNFTSLLTVTATDVDSGANGQITYSLAESARDLFYINPTSGTIYLIGPLDFEAQSEHSFLVFASDNADLQRTQGVLVRIKVIDVNDVGPQFTLSSYTAVVSEGSTTFESPVTVNAIDPANATARITYRIVSGNTPTNSFVLNVNSGTLTLREPLNFDQFQDSNGIIILTVEASDNDSPPQTATSQITVNVIDENNHMPVFSQVFYTKVLQESVPPGTSVVQVTATDADSGSNGEVSYRMGTGGRDNFVVGSNGTVRISNNPTFDYDLFTQMTVQVIAVDGGSPQRSATATISISITDANNKSPRFLQSLYNVIVNDSIPLGTTMLQVRAVDPDSANRLEYSIDTNSIIAINEAGARVLSASTYDYRRVFAINPNTGVITLDVNGVGFNRNYVVEMSFQVLVRDVATSAIGQQTDTTQVTITINGRPDVELYFNMPWTKDNPVYVIPILENYGIGREIMKLQARDPADINSIVAMYEEVPNSDPGNYFTVMNDNNQGAKVVLNRLLDFESGELTHSVVVRAIKTSNLFGSVQTRTVTATVSVVVQDYNDNKPEFTRPSYRFSVREGAPVNFQVGIITAQDVDSASFGPIEFYLGGGLGRNDFKLFQPDDGNTVQLLVAEPLDFERRSFYSIDIIASDNKYGQGSAIRLINRAALEIQILDENDNKPNFTDSVRKSRSFSVPETAGIQTRLGQILASDSDFGLNGRITYTLEEESISPGALQLFTITEQNGILLTRASLRGMSGEYRMRVIATDGGVPPLRSALPIIVKVQGAQDDDGTPQWSSPDNNYIVYVQECNGTRLEVTELDVYISAKARSENGSIIYSLVEYSDDYRSFSINPANGTIYITECLDREIRSAYTLVIQALDSASGEISRRTLNVELIDVDDNEPSFLSSNYLACPDDFQIPTQVYAEDNTPAGVIVGYAVACDPDGPNNNNIYYYIYTSNITTNNNLCQDSHSGAFKVNLNGSIETTRMLDFEERHEYLVCVQFRSTPMATGGRVKRSFDAGLMTHPDQIGYVVITIIDINDNGPVFPQDTLTTVLETIPSEELVVQVQAEDPDSPANSRAVYFISDTTFYPYSARPPFSMLGAFAINAANGLITTNRPTYEDFANGYFVLDIVVLDAKNNWFNDSMTVKVIMHQRSQVMRIVLDRPPASGLLLASNILRDLNAAGQPDKDFIFKTVSEHRTGSNIVATQTDVCFVIVENNKALGASEGIGVLDSSEFRTILDKVDLVDRGTCYQLVSTEDTVKWRDLWWVLVVIAIFIFICVSILIGTMYILYDRYKNYMDTQKTYLVPQ